MTELTALQPANVEIGSGNAPGPRPRLARLLELRDKGVSPRDLADRFGRSLKAVTNKLKQLRSGAK